VRHGHFDSERHEYVIDHPEAVEASWINYLGVEDYCAILNQHAGGYSFYKSSERGRVTRFRPNGVPKDRPGHWVYLRDGGEVWSPTCQPCPKADARYTTRHGLSYSVFESEYRGILASQRVFVPLGEDAEVIEVTLTNRGPERRELDVFGYVEFSFHTVSIDNQNFQMSLYAAGSSCRDGVVTYDFYYEPWTYHYFTSNLEPVGFDCLRDSFIGPWRDESAPLAVERGACSGSEGTTGNHCGALQHRIALEPGETKSLAYFLGHGDHDAGAAMRVRHAGAAEIQAAFDKLGRYWADKRAKLAVETPSPVMNDLLNDWTLFQAETCVVWSRFASFVEVGGRTGLGYRDTAQDSMAVAHSNPAKTKARLLELLHGQMSAGYGLHLFDPLLFEGPRDDIPVGVKLPTVVPERAEGQLHGIEDACSDDHLWLVQAVLNYVTETGETDFLLASAPFADGGEASVYEHLKRAVDFTTDHLGAHGIAQGLRADWNDCLNLGGGESALVTFLHIWAAEGLARAAEHLGRHGDAQAYRGMAATARDHADQVLWDGRWYVRGFTKQGQVIGSQSNDEGKIFLEHMPWAVLCGPADREHALQAMDSVRELLASEYGTHLVWPSYTRVDDSVGYVTRVYPGVKENGAVFCHPNAWPVIAETMLGRGDRAMDYYQTMAPANFNDAVERRRAEPYVYCQFVYGRDHALYGQAENPWLTGTAGWMYQAATRHILGLRPDFDGLVVDPCLPGDWDGFHVVRQWRGAVYDIAVHNPEHVCAGVAKATLDGAQLPLEHDAVLGRDLVKLPIRSAGERVEVEVWLGR
jgi:N,N'-diacetylchitobiose phosphorylase